MYFMRCYAGEKIALFIDGSNLYAAARALGFDIDYRKLLDFFSTKGRLIRAFYYTALSCLGSFPANTMTNSPLGSVSSK